MKKEKRCQYCGEKSSVDFGHYVIFECNTHFSTRNEKHNKRGLHCHQTVEEKLTLSLKETKRMLLETIGIIADIRHAVGDNGERMQDELIQYCAALKSKADVADKKAK